MVKPWLAAMLNIVPGIGIGYLYLRSFGWWLLALLGTLVLLAIDFVGGILFLFICWIKSAPECSDDEWAAAYTRVVILFVVTFLPWVLLNTWNAWRLASRRNTKMEWTDTQEP